MLALHHYARLVAAATFVLIVAGGLVTSTDSGLAVPDWPTTYGYNMFAFPLSKMVGGIFYEHGHRLVASSVGLLTIGLTAWLWWREPRRWLRRLGLLALGAIVLQGLLGGITVLYFLPAPVSIAHAGLAQLFFGLIVAIALFTSPGWCRGYSGIDDPRLAHLAVATTGAVYGQMLLGAVMRHLDAGLAIPDFPLVFGGLVPPVWSTAIAIHYAHRVGAAIVLALVLALAQHIRHHAGAAPEFRRPLAALVGFTLVEIGLGGWTVLSGNAVGVTTAHVATGALVLASALVIALRAHRARFDRPEPVRDRTATKRPVAAEAVS
jgi:cytochrome c oxidase assembly protein subunit 15